MEDDSNEETSLARFKQVVDAYGAEPGRWPADERKRLLAFAASSSHARAHWAQAGRLDDALSKHASPPVSPDLADRLIDLLPEAAERRKPVSNRSRAAAMALSFGVLAIAATWLGGRIWTAEVSDRERIAPGEESVLLDAIPLIDAVAIEETRAPSFGGDDDLVLALE
jgi:hypothetical protein